MIDFLVYSLDTGEILRTGEAPEDQVTVQAGDGESVLLLSGQIKGDDYYVDPESEKLMRKEFFPGFLNHPVIAADSEDSAMITRIPAGTLLVVNGLVDQTYTIEDGEFELSVSMPGIYKVVCTHPQFKTGEFSIEGIAPKG